MEKFTRDIFSRVEVISTKYQVEFIRTIDGRVVLLPINVKTEIEGSATLVKTGDNETNIPSRINVVENLYGNELLNGRLEYQENEYDEESGSLLGSATIEKEDASIDSILRGELEYKKDETSSEIEGTAYVPLNESNSDLLVGSATIEKKDGSIDSILTGELDYRQNESRTEIDGIAYVPSTISRNDLLLGSATIEKEESFEDAILRGELTYERRDLSMSLFGRATIEKEDGSKDAILRGELDYQADEYEGDILTGNLTFERDKTNHTIYGEAIIEKEDASIDSILTGELEYQAGEIKQDLLVGETRIDNNLHSSYLMGWAKIRPSHKTYSIFSTIKVPHSVVRDIVSRIDVDDHNYHKHDLLGGKLEIVQESVGVDLLTGEVELLPTIYDDIVGQAKIEPIHTRREFSANMYVVTNYSTDMPSTIEVIEPIVRSYEDSILSSLIVGNRGGVDIPSSIMVHRTDGDGVYPNHVGARIAIVVSPTWRYEPFVFKSCLVTLLDRYYRKLDIDIVFGGSKRADFDIINLANNYRITGDHLLQVPIHYDCHNHASTMASVDHFIHHMSQPKEGYPLSRVFLFLDKPSWYYNDPIGKIAEWCKLNNVSCVGIDSGGDFQEILDRDKVMDAINMSIEHERHMRMHPRYAIENRRLPDVDPNEIVF